MPSALRYGAGDLARILPSILMKKEMSSVASKVSNEPLGIIISQGDTREPTPVFSAYIWAPAPEIPSKKATRAA
jgi:hypothetical protein